MGSSGYEQLFYGFLHRQRFEKHRWITAVNVVFIIIIIIIITVTTTIINIIVIVTLIVKLSRT
jgi:hypothetical protein